MASLVTRLHRRLLRTPEFPSPLVSIKTTVAGKAFTVPVVDRAYAQASEPWIVDLFRKLLGARHGTFVDVGVNVGQTLLAVKGIEPDRQYIGFEPNPRCVAYCERLIALNGIMNATLVPAGLAAASGLRRLHFYSAASFDAAASMIDDFRPGEAVKSEAVIAVVSMRDAMQALHCGPLAILKIDTEGAESEILTAMRDVIAADRPWIVTEVLPPYKAENSVRIARQETIEALLKDLDYRILRIGKSASDGLSGLSKIESFGVHADITMSDYVLAPAQDVSRVISLARP